PLLFTLLLPRRVRGGVQASLAMETSGRARPVDELQHHLIAHQRLPRPVPADKAEHAMLDPIPLRGPRRVMHHRDDQPAFVRQPLQGDFPRPPAVAVSRVWPPSSRRLPSRPLLHSLLTRENTIDRRLAERTGSGYTDPEAACVARLTISSGFPTSMSDASELPDRRFARTRWSGVVAAGPRGLPQAAAPPGPPCRLCRGPP